MTVAEGNSATAAAPSDPKQKDSTTPPQVPPKSAKMAVKPAASAPAPASPSPLTIGKSFIKQYYQVLSTNPGEITKFYKPNSVISHSLLPSVPAEPQTLSNPADPNDPNPLFHWASTGTGSLQFDFGKGAIDAQETINGGILLVVTGHIKISIGVEDDASKKHEQGFKPFVHTFFLNNAAPAGKKRQFYVHNDILRFLSTQSNDDVDDDVETSTGASTPAPSTSITSNERQVPEPVQAETNKTSTPTTEALSVVSTTPDPQDQQTPSRSTPVTTNVSKEKDTEAETEKTDKEDEPATTKTSAPSTKSKSQKDSNAKKKDTKESSTSNSESSKSGAKKNKEQTTSPTTSKPNGKTTSVPTSNSSPKSNETPVPSNTATTSNSKEDKKPRKNKSRGRSRKSRSASPNDKNDIGNTNGSNGTGKKTKQKKAETPGSWASLVAGGAAPHTAKPSPAAEAAANTAAAQINAAETDKGKEKEKERDGKNKGAHKTSSGTSTNNSSKNSSTDAANSSSSNTNNGSKPAHSQSQSQAPKEIAPQRTPEATILIKNIPDRSKEQEAEIRAMFEPYATKLKQKILGITHLVSRGYCFVDFDSKIVVDEIIKDIAASGSGKKKEGEAKSKFMMNGRVLDVGRKNPSDKNAGGRGRKFRSASPGNGGYKQSRGGRRNSPRGGNRSGKK